MVCDANRCLDQIVPVDPVPFGPLELAVGRRHAEGLSTRVTLLPDLDNLYDITMEKHVDNSLGKLSLGTEIKLGTLFASIELTLGPDEKTAMGIITEYSSDSTSGEVPRRLFLSTPGEKARRVDIEKRPSIVVHERDRGRFHSLWIPRQSGHGAGDD
ncbi:hypothetical protein N8T08_004814 [Aspergillus melleus]|uniref:Uncharacterized protein n=1 Tax=Aspergillus melleus TaxID=138277 RepID=A0ACC3B3E0_9EURO|nr:hypothetical protein N8T08_004814 [Aspergillus melleus]